jgi:hypothetical protein
MFQFKRDFEARFHALRDVEATRRLYPKLQTFEQWLGNNRDALPIEPVAATA